jgi:hypothetical protein
MKRILLAAAVVAVLITTITGNSFAQKGGPHEAEFRAFYAEFLKAVQANDKEKIADMIKFPVGDWSVDTKGNVETIAIKDRPEFIRRYNTLFTNSMRLRVVKAKPAALQDGRYTVIWRTSDVECSFEFEYINAVGYRLTAYGIGPI